MISAKHYLICFILLSPFRNGILLRGEDVPLLTEKATGGVLSESRRLKKVSYLYRAVDLPPDVLLAEMLTPPLL